MVSIVARRGYEQFLIDAGEGRGQVFDAVQNRLFEPFAIDDIVARGFWIPTTTSLIEASVMEKIEAALPLDTVTAAGKSGIKRGKGPGEFTLTLIDEAEPTIDGRVFDGDAVTWRDPPLSLMYLTENVRDGHKGAKVGGSIQEIWREGSKILGRGTFESGDNGQELRRLMDEGALTGVSSDVGGALVIDELSEDGSKQSRITTGKIMGATVLPFPAFDDTRAAIAAAAVIVAAIPENPPAEWFENPKLSGPMPFTIDEMGRITGHAALWGTCHIGTTGQCITPPNSRHDYAYFHTGEVFCADGKRRAVGTVTLGTGHAKLALGYRPAAEHYDNTGTQVADVVTGEDAHGVWVAGALRPNVSPERLRELRASALSGDWRSVGGGLELVALLAVNTPGFPIPRTRASFSDEAPLAMVAAGIPGTEHTHEQETPVAEDEATTASANSNCNCGSGEAELAVEEMSVEEMQSLSDRLDGIETALTAIATHVAERTLREAPSLV